MILFESRKVQYIFEMRLLRYLGKISFSIYLMHMLVLNGMMYFNLLELSVVSLMLAILLTTAVSTLTFYLIEDPSRAVIRQFGAKYLNA